MAITKITTPDLIDLKNSQLASGVATTYVVTVPAYNDPGTANKYFVNGVQQPNIVLIPGTQYIITQDDVSNSSHPILLSTSIANSGAYTTGVVYYLNGNVVTDLNAYIAGFAAASARKIIVILSAPPTTLYYICYYHQNMGNTVITVGGALNTDGIVLAKGTTSAVASVQYLVVAGGGGGAGAQAGGGGAGGLLTATADFSTGISLSLTIGTGGSGGSYSASGTYFGGDGNNSIFSSIVTNGGGGASAYNNTVAYPGRDGGSGGGGGGVGGVSLGGATVGVGQGNAGGSVNSYVTPYSGGGGGGAGGAGTSINNSGDTGVGGIGLQNNITGTNLYYAGGGGGAGEQNYVTAGGSGGGGAGGGTPVTGTNGLGGGGGGSSWLSSSSGANGGSGVIILRMASTTTAAFSAGVTFTLDNTSVAGQNIYRITATTNSTQTVTFSITGDGTGRPSTAVDGEFRYNTTTKKVEFYDGTAWFALTSTTIVPQTGTTGTCNYPATATALYQLNSGVGSNVPDTCGNYDGTGTSITYSAGKFGNAASFNGSSSYIDTSLTIPVNSNFSTSCWINISSAQSQGFIIAEGDWNAWSTASFGIAFTGSSIIELSIGNNGGSGGTQVQSSSGISLNNWTNIVGVIDIGNTLKLYINGVEVATTPLSSNNRNPGSPSGFKFGGANSSYYFNGLIDQVRIFPSALTVDQVSALYTETAP